jgi:hypothetical protein
MPTLDQLRNAFKSGAPVAAAALAVEPQPAAQPAAEAAPTAAEGQPLSPVNTPGMLRAIIADDIRRWLACGLTPRQITDAIALAWEDVRGPGKGKVQWWRPGSAPPEAPAPAAAPPAPTAHKAPKITPTVKAAHTAASKGGYSKHSSKGSVITLSQRTWTPTGREPSWSGGTGHEYSTVIPLPPCDPDAIALADALGGLLVTDLLAKDHTTIEVTWVDWKGTHGMQPVTAPIKIELDGFVMMKPGTPHIAMGSKVKYIYDAK